MSRRSLLFAAWIGLCAAGIGALVRYQTAPGPSGDAPSSLPSSGSPVLLVFAHPKCPCSRATIENLDWLMARARGLKARVFFYRPGGEVPGWEKTALWRGAARNPGASVAPDVDGLMARRFGAMTSGQALLYDGRGRLVYAGGLTAGRGHAGPSAGRDAVLELLSGARTPENARLPVFGCSLRGA